MHKHDSLLYTCQYTIDYSSRHGVGNMSVLTPASKVRPNQSLLIQVLILTSFTESPSQPPRLHPPSNQLLPLPSQTPRRSPNPPLRRQKGRITRSPHNPFLSTKKLCRPSSSPRRKSRFLTRNALPNRPSRSLRRDRSPSKRCRTTTRLQRRTLSRTSGKSCHD